MMTVWLISTAAAVSTAVARIADEHTPHMQHPTRQQQQQQQLRTGGQEVDAESRGAPRKPRHSGVGHKHEQRVAWWVGNAQLTGLRHKFTRITALHCKPATVSSPHCVFGASCEPAQQGRTQPRIRRTGTEGNSVLRYMPNTSAASSMCVPTVEKAMVAVVPAEGQGVPGLDNPCQRATHRLWQQSTAQGE